MHGQITEACLIVVGELFSREDVALGVDHNVLVTLDRDDLGIAVGITAVVDEARQTTLHHAQQQSNQGSWP